MNRSILAAIAVCAALPAAAEIETYAVDPRHTFPTYEILHFGIAFQRGRAGSHRPKRRRNQARHLCQSLFVYLVYAHGRRTDDLRPGGDSTLGRPELRLTIGVTSGRCPGDDDAGF